MSEVAAKTDNRKLISIVLPCYNEAGNIEPLYERLKAVCRSLGDYTFEYIFSDNASTDRTVEYLRELASIDKKVKLIVNARNFGPARSMFNAVLAAKGDAVVLMATDLQDPPEMITGFVEKWRCGYKVVFGIRSQRNESWLLVSVRRFFYRLLKSLSEDPLVNDAGEFFLIDRQVVDILREVKTINPYLRGMIASTGLPTTGIDYDMVERKSGKTKGSIFGYYAYALSGFVNHTMLPLRIASFSGVLLAVISFLFALVQLTLKLIFWDQSPKGIPTLIIGISFVSGVQLFLLGLLGEYVGVIYRQVQNYPLVVENDRVNFDNDESK